MSDDGGPAFPSTQSVNASGSPVLIQDSCAMIKSSEGMTLRDYFAAKVFAALITSDRQDKAICYLSEEHRVPAEEISATIAYEFADAMLEARKKQLPRK